MTRIKADGFALKGYPWYHIRRFYLKAVKKYAYIIIDKGNIYVWNSRIYRL